MRRFRKKPVVIEAMQFTSSNGQDVVRWCNRGSIFLAAGGTKLQIDTLEGSMLADYGDWIIRGVQLAFYPCKPDIFEATYEEQNA